MKFSRALFILTLLLVSNFFINTQVVKSQTNNSSTYTWIWDEFDQNEVGYIEGDNSIIWGSSLGPFYNSTESLHKLQRAASMFPELVNYFEIGTSHLGKPISGVKLSISSNTAPVKYETIVVGNHHAREAITVLDALLVMDALIFNAMQGDPWVVTLLTHVDVYIIPVLNPDGLDYLHINPWQRRNLQPFDGDGDSTTIDELEIQDINEDGYISILGTISGVYLEGVDGEDQDSLAGDDLPGGIDLNRNYGYEFIGSGSSTHNNSFSYRGPAPFSAPETSAYRDFALQHRFFTAVSLHSGIEAIITPWGYTDMPTAESNLFGNISADLKEIAQFPTWAEIGGYTVNGEWGDWMYGRFQTIALTIETYGNNTAIQRLDDDSEVGIWDLFNPNADIAISRSLERVFPQIRHLLAYPLYDETKHFFELSSVTTNPEANIATISGKSNSTELVIALEQETSTFGWEKLDEKNINQTGDFSVNINTTALSSDNYRIYIGKQSRGNAYFLDLRKTETYSMFNFGTLNKNNKTGTDALTFERIVSTTSQVTESSNPSQVTEATSSTQLEATSSTQLILNFISVGVIFGILVIAMFVIFIRRRRFIVKK